MLAVSAARSPVAVSSSSKTWSRRLPPSLTLVGDLVHGRFTERLRRHRLLLYAADMGRGIILGRS